MNQSQIEISHVSCHSLEPDDLHIIDGENKEI
jgi:hypothetical protein